MQDQELIQLADKLLQDKNIRITNFRRLQSLWAGYGSILKLRTDSKTIGTPQHLIFKHITPPSTKNDQDEGHLRKIISYQVEQYFYQHLAPQLPQDVAVATCFASINEGGTIALVFSDLSETFAIAGEKRGELSEKQAFAALDWLAKFHGFWWKRVGEFEREKLRRPPLEDARTAREGMWLNGGYTYLATRRKEFASLQNDSDSEWSERLCQPVPERKESIAELVAQVLSPSPSSQLSPISKYETLIHGDVKSENLFTSSSETAAAFFDFQYVGLGLGVCDLAKLFTCSVPQGMLSTMALGHDEGCDMGKGERMLLEYYRDVIEKASGKEYPWDVLEMHWKTALVDWLRFQASWGFWGNTTWLEARVRNILKDETWLNWVLETPKATPFADHVPNSSAI